MKKYLKYIVGNDYYFFLTNLLFLLNTRLHALTRNFKSILREAIIEKVCKMRVRPCKCVWLFFINLFEKIETK